MGGGYDELIIESLLNLFATVLKSVFGWINFPDLPVEISMVINQLFDYMRSGIGLVFLFVPMPLVRILLPLVVVVVNFDKVYKLVMFVIRKIPFLGVG